MTAKAVTWAVIVAGGQGTRFGSYKQFAPLGGRSVADWSLDVAATSCDGVVLVVPEGLLPVYRTRAERVVCGGVSRPASVRAGIAAVPRDAAVIVVHDAARPLASEHLWHAVVSAVLDGAEAAVPCVPVTDTVKQRSDDGRLLTLDRTRLLLAQTPQAFQAARLRAAHASNAEASDDAALVEALGGHVVVVPGEGTNMKLTGPLDLAAAEALLSLLRPHNTRGEEPRPGAGSVP
ncbi:MAG TPA: 2-C-methyl-D-erythritol 4-phosphate cytidylyltransferase [Acidimicrobiales bacterium]|nr:2-C-methyl-D-erythritol 4-phosphate cytidylyltransferase [Acidimicrobiales bacterium]